METEENKIWQWYWSTDEEIYRGGPFASREDCIEDAKDECESCDYGSFYIIEATKGEWDLSLTYYQIFDALENNNEENVNPDGDGFESLFSKEQKDELVLSINSAIIGWSKKQNMPHVWSFNETRNSEQIAIRQAGVEVEG